MEDITNKYLINSDSYEMFDNISRFVKNATLKDSKKFYNAENDLSKFFGNMLIKYYTVGLTIADITKIIEYSEAYNKSVDETFSSIDNVLKYIFGIIRNGKAEDYKEAGIIKESTFFYKFCKYLASASNTPEDFMIPVYTYIYRYIYAIINNIKDEEINNITVDISDIKEFFNPTESTTKKLTPDNQKDLGDYIKLLKNKEKIYINRIENPGTKSKSAASAIEMTHAENGDFMTFFDIESVRVTNSEYANNNILKNYATIVDSSASSSDYLLSVLISYKEFNPEYREILDANLSEVAQQIYLNTLLKALPIANISDMYSKFRNIKDTHEILVTTNYSSDRFRYLHANPFVARRAEESSIIAYYYGDNYYELSYGYGQYGYQIEEILRFLDIFAETRDYFYKVLLNKSFVLDEQYPLYEKFFLSCVSIERFLSSKNRTLKDIESMNSTDISNFMQSYGLKELDDKVNSSATFLNREYYLKQLLHNHVQLMQEKGSRAVIDRLIKVFGYNNEDVTITKYLLVDNTEKNKDTGAYTKLPKFIETPYTNQNFLKDIVSALNSSSSKYGDFLDNTDDEYWTKESLPEDIVNQLDLNVSETKYLALRMTRDASETYYASRYLVSLMKIFSDSEIIKSNLGLNNKNITVDTYVASLLDIFNGITYCFSEIVKLYEEISVLDDVETPKYKYYGFTVIPNLTDLSDIISANDSNVLSLSDKADELANEIKINKGSDAVGTKLNNYINGLTLIYKPYLDTDANNFDNFKGIIGDETDSSRKMYLLVEKALDLPIKYLTQGLYRENTNNWTSYYDKVMNTLFENYCLSDKDPLDNPEMPDDFSLKEYLTTSATDSDTMLSFYTDKLINLCALIRSIYPDGDYMQIYFSLVEDEQREVDFLKTVVNFYISYTTQLRDARLKKKFAQKAESYYPTDIIDSIKIHQIKVDSVFYDEKCVFKKI